MLFKDFKVYWWSQLLKILKIPVRPQKEKRKFCKSDNRKGYLANLNLKRSTCSIWESFQRTVLQGKNGSPGKNRYRKHGWVVIRTEEGAGSTVGTGGKMFLVAAHKKHVWKRIRSQWLTPNKIRKNAQNTRSRHHKNEIPWCSGYHICFTRRRSPVRCRLESTCFKINLWILYSRAFLEDSNGHQKYKQPFTGIPLKGFRLNYPRTLYCTEESHLLKSLNVTGSISGGK